MKIKKINQAGFSHHIVFMLIVVALISGLGAYMVTRSHADTISEKAQSKGFTNPVIDEALPDPSVIRDSDGLYHLYATGTADNGSAFPHYVSKNLTDWRKVKYSTLTTTPACVGAGKIKWAPDVAKVGKKYFLTFTCGPDQQREIGYAYSNSAGGPFTYKGTLVSSGENHNKGAPDGLGTIDSHIFSDGGRAYLYYGGGHIGVASLKVNGNTLTLGNNYRRIMSGKFVGSEWTTAEASWVTKRGSWYYLFYSYGDYSLQSGPREYSVRVARSTSPLGPFTPDDTSRIGLRGSGPTLRGPGHNSVTTDDNGNYWMVYHAWKNGKRVVNIDSITYKSGWPVVGTNNSPKIEHKKVPYIK